MKFKIQIFLCLLAVMTVAPALQARSWSKASAANKAACLKWCGANKHCRHCSTTRHCGAHYEKMKIWDGWGRNYSACKKSAHVTSIWGDYANADIYSTTKALVVTLGGMGASKSSKDDGFEWFCEDYVHRTSLAKKVKCISSYGSVFTNSSTLSSNIESVISKIKSKTGRTPTVILVGKSMGGCKLQHAVYKRSLNNNTIHTFIGVDTSCWVNEHWQDNDLLLFRSNVKRLFNFYQTNGPSQTGHHLVFLDRFSGSGKNSEGEVRKAGRPAYDSRAPRVNVASQNYDLPNRKYKSGRMCSSRTTHSDGNPIDRCVNLRNGVFNYIKKIVN